MSFMDAFLAREKRLLGSTLRKKSHFWFAPDVVTGVSYGDLRAHLRRLSGPPDPGT